MKTISSTRALASLYDLAPGALVSLFKLTLPGGTVFRFCPFTPVTWQANFYDHLSCSLTEAKIEADGKVNRPNFSVTNPNGIFTPYAVSGLENAILTRYELLADDLVNNRGNNITTAMRIAQVTSINRQLIVCQIRDIFDGPGFVLPVRSYMPPEFPNVKLS